MAAKHIQTGDSTGQPGKPNRTLVRPSGTSRESLYEAAVEMFRIVAGREPTDEEIAELDEHVRRKMSKGTDAS